MQEFISEYNTRKDMNCMKHRQEREKIEYYSM